MVACLLPLLFKCHRPSLLFFQLLHLLLLLPLLPLFLLFLLLSGIPLFLSHHFNPSDIVAVLALPQKLQHLALEVQPPLQSEDQEIWNPHIQLDHPDHLTEFDDKMIEIDHFIVGLNNRRFQRRVIIWI
jgi:hypothetical protein